MFGSRISQTEVRQTPPPPDCYLLSPTPEVLKAMADLNSGKLGHRSVVVNPGSSAFQRVKAKLQPADAKKSISMPDSLHTFHDNRGCTVYNVAFKECYGAMIPVLVDVKFYPAPPKQIRVPGNHRWHRSDDE